MGGAHSHPPGVADVMSMSNGGEQVFARWIRQEGLPRVEWGLSRRGLSNLATPYFCSMHGSSPTAHQAVGRRRSAAPMPLRKVGKDRSQKICPFTTAITAMIVSNNQSEA